MILVGILCQVCLPSENRVAFNAQECQGLYSLPYQVDSSSCVRELHEKAKTDLLSVPFEESREKTLAGASIRI